MRSFYYRPGRNAFMALSAAVSAMYMANNWWQDGGTVMLIGVALFGVAAVKAGMNAINTSPALRFDQDRLWIRTAFTGLHELRWSEVHAITLEVYTVRKFGIPVSRTESIFIRCEGGLFGTRRLGLSANTLQLPGGGAKELLDILKQAHVAAVGIAGVAMAGAGRHGWGVAPEGEPAEHSTDVFDPDAAIARYLESKQQPDQAEQAPPSSPPPAPAATHRSAMPQRPVFGRRVA